MDFKVLIADSAIADFKEIVEFVAEDNPEAAIGPGEKLFAHALSLATLPDRFPFHDRRRGIRKNAGIAFSHLLQMRRRDVCGEHSAFLAWSTTPTGISPIGKNDPRMRLRWVPKLSTTCHAVAGRRRINVLFSQFILHNSYFVTRFLFYPLLANGAEETRAT